MSLHSHEILETVRMVVDQNFDVRTITQGIDLHDCTDAMNEVWDAWAPAGDTPPRATVQAALARPQWRIEIVATAAQG